MSIAPLAFFRMLFGAMMLFGTLRFAYMGWIHDLYIAPKLHFPFDGFAWLSPLPPIGMYGVYVVMGLAALGIMLGYRYRWNTVLFFLTFTYTELLDKANYLNHYYFVSLVAGLLIVMPANRAYSLDALRKPSLQHGFAPAWCLWLLRFQLSLVYIFAGIAKIHPEWLLEAMPLKIWLPANAQLPLIGPLLKEAWVAYAFSWSGMLYDLFIPFLLLYRPTRIWAYTAVVAFHLLTGLLFPIGMFPYLMIGATLIFFPASFHEKWLTRLINGIKRLRKWQIMPKFDQNHTTFAQPNRPLPSYYLPHWGSALLGVYIVWQLLMPWRFMLYPGNVLWTEQGYRFAWRVMLTEKAGAAFFYVTDPQTGSTAQITNRDYLTPNQEKMLSFQPDMLLHFAHYLADEYRKQGIEKPEVSAEVYVSFNGRRNQLLVDRSVILSEQPKGWAHKSWIKPLKENAAMLVKQAQ